MNYKTLFLLVIGLFASVAQAQTMDESRVVLGNYLMRQYMVEPTDGCRIYDDLTNTYLISIVTLDKTKYKKSSDMYRVAQLKSMRNAGEYLGGTTQHTVTRIVMNDDDVAVQEESTHAFSSNMVKSLELLKSFDFEENEKVFIYIQVLE
jgi:hypothetical protein